MIFEKINGDILSTTDNPFGYIIIGMNTDLRELTPLARNFVGGSITGPVEKGSVMTFKYDGLRRIHMIIIHDLNPKGWEEAPKYLRLGLDILWMQSQKERGGEFMDGRGFNIVQIGNGKIGKKYNANVYELERAMQESFLPLTLFKNNTTADAVAVTPINPELLELVSTVFPAKAMAATAH